MELAGAMRRNGASEGFRAEARELVLKVLHDLPGEARGFAGADDAGLDEILAEGAELVTARLKSGAAR